MEKKYIIKSSLRDVDSVIKEISSDVNIFFAADDLREFLLGVYEMAVNAVEHGNFAITYEMKKDWLRNDVYEEELANLINKLGHKQIFINLEISKNIIIIKIQDEGKGFNIQEQMKKQTMDNILRESGRGIIITKHFFDDVSYNEKGNEVTITKILKNKLN